MSAKVDFNNVIGAVLTGLLSVLLVALSLGAAMWAIKFALTQIISIRGL